MRPAKNERVRKRESEARREGQERKCERMVGGKKGRVERGQRVVIDRDTDEDTQMCRSESRMNVVHQWHSILHGSGEPLFFHVRLSLLSMDPFRAKAAFFRVFART